MVWTNRIAQELLSMLPADMDRSTSAPPRSRPACRSAPPTFSSVGKGDRVQISEGTFCGIEGTVVDHRGANRVIIAVELLETAVTIEIDVSRVQLLDAHQRMRFGR